MKLILILAVAPLLLYNNCSQLVPPVSNGASSLSLGQCEEFLKFEYSKTYYPFIVSQCASCHYYGGSGNGAFADGDLSYAFSEFNIRGSDLIVSRAVDPNHKPPWTGPSNQASVNGIDPSWKSAVAAYNSCKSKAGGGSDGEGGTGPGGEVGEGITEASYITINKTIGTADNPVTMSWDLTDEFSYPSSASFPGVSLEMTVQNYTSPTGDRAYIFSRPTLFTPTENLRIAYIDIRINGVLVNTATTYKGIDTVIAAGATGSAAVLSLTGMVVPTVYAASDTLALGIGLIGDGEPPPPPVDPPPPPPTPGTVTLATLNATGGVFQRNCNGCHGNTPSNGAPFSLTSNNVAGLSGLGYINIGDANGSLLYQRIIDTVSPMPPGGQMSAQDIAIVRDWINAGAPD